MKFYRRDSETHMCVCACKWKKQQHDFWKENKWTIVFEWTWKLIETMSISICLFDMFESISIKESSARVFLCMCPYGCLLKFTVKCGLIFRSKRMYASIHLFLQRVVVWFGLVWFLYISVSVCEHHIDFHIIYIQQIRTFAWIFQPI